MSLHTHGRAARRKKLPRFPLIVFWLPLLALCVLAAGLFAADLWMHFE